LKIASGMHPRLKMPKTCGQQIEERDHSLLRGKTKEKTEATKPHGLGGQRERGLSARRRELTKTVDGSAASTGCDRATIIKIRGTHEERHQTEN